MHRRKLAAILFLLIVAAILAAAFFSPLGDWLTLERLKGSHARLVELIEAQPALYTGGFFLLCILASAVCFPVAPLIGIAAGGLFGFRVGFATMLTGFTIGSTIAFFNSRYLLRDWVKARFGRQLKPIDRGFEQHGAGYLLAVRFNPLIPYWLVNLAMGVTTMRPAAYVPLTAIGLSPAIFIYVNAGTQLAAVRSVGDIVSGELLIALLLLSLFPLGAEFLRTRLAARSD